MTDAQLRNVHDRATRGEHLTTEEQAALETWYLQQDQAESQLLLDRAQSEPLVQLRAQVAATAAQLEIVTQHIREVLETNDKVRREIALLQRQLVQQPADRAA
jgi:hypothetical protein